MNYYAYPWSRWIKWGAIALLVIIILVNGISTYNSVVTLDQKVKSNWSQVENVMQRRADLVVNLVEVVKGYTKHEEKVFGDIANARASLMSGNDDVKSKLDADNTIKNAASQILLLVENYPDLKSSEQFLNLQTEIAGSENRVSVERKRFIESVQTYNSKIKQFPGNIFARLMGFTEKDYFTADEEAQKVPKVQFD